MEKKKVVALLSGGLDSQLAVRMMQKQGFDVSAVEKKKVVALLSGGWTASWHVRMMQKQVIWTVNGTSPRSRRRFATLTAAGVAGLR